MADTQDQLHRLMQEVALLKQRQQFTEDQLVKLRSEQRGEVLHTLGVALLQLGEKLVHVANSEKQFKVVPVSDSEKPNDQTFYATRTEEGWVFSTLQNGTMAPFDLTTTLQNMRTAIEEHLATVQESSTAFNVYRK